MKRGVGILREPGASASRGFSYLLLMLLCVNGTAHGTQVGSVFSGPTSPDPASTYWNPAAMTLLEGHHLMAFGALAAIRLDYQRDVPSAHDGQPFSRADVFIAKPSVAFGLVTDAGQRDLRFGLAVTLPILDGASWKKEYGDRPSSTRYYALDARLGFLLIEPSVGYKVNRYLAIGGGLDIVGAMLAQDVMTDFGAKINQLTCASDPSTCALDSPFPREDPTLDALTKISGFGWGVGLFGGILLTPTPWLRAGFGIHSGALSSVSIPAQLSVELPEAVTEFMGENLSMVSLPALTAEGDVEVNFPTIMMFGLAINPHPRVELTADLHWMDSSRTSVMLGTITKDQSGGLISNQVLIKARTDSFLLGLAGKVQLHESLVGVLRLEYDANTRPEKYTSPVCIDYHKLSVHLGLSWQMTDNLALTAEYGHYILLSRTISDSDFAPNAAPTTPLEEGLDKPPPTGEYTGIADRFGLGLSFRF